MEKYWNFCLSFIAIILTPYCYANTHPSSILSHTLPDFNQTAYQEGIEQLLNEFENAHSTPIQPGPKKRIGLKVYTASGKGMSTPIPLVIALIEALEKRGFARSNMVIIDYSENNLRKAGFLPALSQKQNTFEGVPVHALDTNQYWDPNWFYENYLPSREDYSSFNLWTQSKNNTEDRKSLLPVELLCDFDYWINLPMATNSYSLGISGAIANATLLNISNYKRFLSSLSVGPMAAAEILAIPELNQSLIFTIISLEKYQYVGEYIFNENYTESKNLLLLSRDPIALDRYLLGKINTARIKNGFPIIKNQSLLFEYCSILK